MLKYQSLRVGFVAIAILLAGVCTVPSVVQAKAKAKAEVEAPLFNMDTAQQPDIDKVEALRRLVSNGANLHYMGERSKIHGWFLVKDGGIQMVYLSPDMKTIIIGALISERGHNITNAQVKRLITENPSIKDEISSGKHAKANRGVGRNGGIASVLSGKTGQKAVVEKKPVVPTSPGERLMQDLKAAASVSMGKHKTAKLYMIAAPSCPVCKATWKELRSSIKGGDVEVRMIPVYNNVGGVELNQAAQLLAASNPLTAWDKFVDGDKSALAGEASKLTIRAVKSNLKLVTKWNVQGYPYLAYRGKDGRIKIVQGKPERMAAVLSDLSK